MGALRCVRAFVPEMLSRKSGHIVFISSVAAKRAHSFGGIYAASKSALEVIAETLRLETLPFLKVTVVRPGITDTDFFENEISSHRSLEEMNMGSISPQEIAEDVFYAVSGKSSSCIHEITRRPNAQMF